LAQALTAAGRTEGALKAIEQGIRYGPDLAILWETKAWILSKIGREDEAREAARKARELKQASD
jgi:Flp pilus assembly protein TadD